MILALFYLYKNSDTLAPHEAVDLLCHAHFELSPPAHNKDGFFKSVQISFDNGKK